MTVGRGSDKGWSMEFPYIFLDLDNTILDFNQSSIFAFERALRISDPDLEWQKVFSTFQTISHRLWRDFENGHIERDFLRIERFRQVCAQHSLDVEPQVFSKRYLDLLCENSFFVDGAKELCTYLSENEYQVAAVTNGLEDVQIRRLKSSGLRPYFQGLFCSSEAHRPKPFPDLFSAAHHFFGQPDKQQCLMVGDNLNCDVLGAADFGLQTCWFNPHSEVPPPEIVPHFEVQKLNQIYQLVE